MDILDLKIYKGRNIYSHRPVMKMVLDIGKHGNYPTKDIDGFNEKLINILPSLKTNCCGLGYEGGFIEKLESGTYLAHVVEHVILEMQFLLGYDVRYGKTRVIEEPSIFYLVYEYQNEVCGLECGKAAVFILNCLINGEDIDINEFLEYLKRVSIENELGPSASSIVEEAKKRNIPVTRIGNESLIQLGYGKSSRIIESTLTDATSCISADIASNKQLTKLILKDNQIPVPVGKVVYSEIYAKVAADEIGRPVVIKPYDGNQGKGVHLNLESDEQILSAFKEASKYSNKIIVEQFIKGKDYRILVIGDKVRVVSERLPALVVGDGINSIEKLVEITNQDENRGEHHEKPLTKIKLDEAVLNVLSKKGFDKNYIPSAGEKVVLRENANLSTGGTAIDCTDIIHPDNQDVAVRAAKAIGIDIAGIDVVIEDIAQSIHTSGGVVVEVNAAPGIRMHLFPSQGKPRNVAKDIVDMFYPNDFYFPIISVTGTNGKTTTARLVSHVLSIMGKTVGMTSTSGIYIQGKCILKGDNSGPISAKTLLSNKTIDAAVLETARGGIVREGLGYDLADIGIITNISEDHLGTDEIETLEDLAFVKSLVVEAIKPNGYAVLNADDAMTDYILKRVKVKTILFGKSEDSFKNYADFIQVYQSDGVIKIKNGESIINVLRVDEIPITYGGLVECNIENCLTAISALYGLSVPIETIVTGLKSFTDNSGRFNLFEMKGYKVMLDYAHNKAGYEAVIKTLKGFNYKRLVGIIGMPGDRPNDAIESVGSLCANVFDVIYIKEDVDLRERNKGEVAQLFYDSIQKANPFRSSVKVLDNEISALNTAISDVKEGDLIVVLYEKLGPLVDLLNKQKAIEGIN